MIVDIMLRCDACPLVMTASPISKSEQDRIIKETYYFDINTAYFRLPEGWVQIKGISGKNIYYLCPGCQGKNVLIDDTGDIPTPKFMDVNSEDWWN